MDVWQFTSVSFRFGANYSIQSFEAMQMMAYEENELFPSVVNMFCFCI